MKKKNWSIILLPSVGVLSLFGSVWFDHILDLVSGLFQTGSDCVWVPFGSDLFFFKTFIYCYAHRVLEGFLWAGFRLGPKYWTCEDLYNRRINCRSGAGHLRPTL